jgi:short-subunit dehydrogenase
VSQVERSILIFGGTSAIAFAWAEIVARSGACLFLVGRDQKKLEDSASHLRIKYRCRVGTYVADLNLVETHQSAIKQALIFLGGRLDIVLLAQGQLGDELLARSSFDESHRIIQTNFLSYVSIFTHIVPLMKKQASGQLVALSSVAGDRGRSSNYVYGSAKAGLSCYLSGLRGALTGSGVEVITVKPGLVDTPMTASFRKGALFSSAECVARCIDRGLAKNKPIIYAPRWWQMIMFVIVHIPEFLFRRIQWERGD